jgi:putative ABC transport system substrate-binding protein
MKIIKPIISISLILNVLLFTTIAFNFSNKSSTQQAPIKKAKECNIAIMSLTESPLIEKIRTGFKDTINNESSLNARIRNYAANGDLNLARSQIKEVVQNKFDLIYTIGATYSKLAEEITTKKQHPIPIIFVGFPNPVEQDFATGNHITGITIQGTGGDVSKQLDLLSYLKPQTKHVLILYNATTNFFETDVEKMINKLQERNILSTKLPIYNTKEIMQKASSQIQDVDAIITVRDNVILGALEGLIKLCNNHGITLYTSELESVEKGAAIGFGQNEYKTGVECAQKALQILRDGTNPSDIPTTTFYKPELRINRETSAKQGLVIDGIFLFLVRNGYVI